MNKEEKAKPFAIVIASNNDCFRIGSYEIMRKSSIVEVAEKTKHVKAAVEIIENKKCNVAIVDEGLPPTEGKCSALFIKEKFPDAKVIVVCDRYSEQKISELKECGVTGFLPLKTTKKEIEEALLTSDTIYISKEIKLNFMENKTPDVLNELLTSREIEVFRLLIKGESIKEIGASLFISDFTAYGYRKTILKKTNCANEVLLFRWAIKNTIVTTEEIRNWE